MNSTKPFIGLKIEKIILYLIYTCLFVFILLKAFTIPITHDEVATVIMAKEQSLWQIISYSSPSPNNHLLNTLLTKVFVNLFDVSAFTARTPNVLSFALYCFATFKITKEIIGKQSFFILTTALLFILNPYLLDFFSLSRGYGMSLAFLSLSVYYLLLAFKQNTSSYLYRAVIFSFIASYANFTLLPFMAAMICVSMLWFFILKKENKQVAIKGILFILLLSAVYFLLILQPIIRMQSTNQFQYWHSDGFITNTVIPLLRNSLYGSKVLFFQLIELLFWIIITLFVSNVILVGRTIFKAQNKPATIQQPIVFLNLILWLTITINFAQHFILGTPFFEGRTALFYFPLFILSILPLLERIIEKWNSKGLKIISVLLGIVFVLQIGLNLTIKNVREWAYDENTLSVLDYISNQKDKDMSLATDWMFNPSFFFYSSVTKEYEMIDLEEYSKELHPSSTAEYYYIFSKDYRQFEKNYSLEINFENGCSLLKKR